MDRDEFVILARYLHSISYALTLLVSEKAALSRDSRDLAFQNHQEARNDFWEILAPLEVLRKLEKLEREKIND